ncbi:MAG: hypothetical protein NEHIOOID_01127 [Holosporales bacterium]
MFLKLKKITAVCGFICAVLMNCHAAELPSTQTDASTQFVFAVTNAGSALDALPDGDISEEELQALVGDPAIGSNPTATSAAPVYYGSMYNAPVYDTQRTTGPSYQRNPFDDIPTSTHISYIDPTVSEHTAEPEYRTSAYTAYTAAPEYRASAYTPYTAAPAYRVYPEYGLFSSEDPLGHV